MKRLRHTVVVLLALILSSCGRPLAQPAHEEAKGPTHSTASSPPSAAESNGPQKLEVATLGAGCFWCVEAVFSELRGVKSVVSGYAGGQTENPTYKQVCSGSTGHAEAVQVTFDPSVISYHDLLLVFFTTHDPTTLNRQGADVGTQYRSAIFYTSDAQRQVAEAVKKEVQGEIGSTIVTEITPFTNFYKAEDYHQQYYELNGSQPYCQAVIAPKMAKFRKKYADLLKNAATH